MKKSEITFGILRIPTDFVMTLLAFLIAYKARTITDLIPGITFPFDFSRLPTTQSYFTFAFWCSTGLILLFAFNEMYSLRTTSSFSREIKKTFILSAAWIMLIIAHFFIQHEFPFSRLALGYSWIFTIIFVITGRGIIRLIQYILLKNGIGKRRVAVIGESTFSRDITRIIEKNPRYKLIGFITEKAKHTDRKNFLGTIDELKQLIQTKKIEEIIQTQGNLEKFKDTHIVQLCREHHIAYSFVPDLLEIERANIEISSIDKIPLIKLKPTPLDGWGSVMKRIMDIFGSIVGLIISAPIITVAAIAIKIDSPGPVFFNTLDNGKPALRVGKKGKFFVCQKLRTMQDGAHARRYAQELAEKNLRKGSPLVKIKNDPRITRVGKFLRQFSIDELPQFWNVLKGDMSLVGPRPHLPEEIDKYASHEKFVLEIKPGLTGLPQINGRSDLEFTKEIQLDTWYIQNWSLWLDLRIILKTIVTVVRGYKE